MKVVSIIIIAGIVFSTGCASMFSGTSQQVSISSEEDGTKIYANGNYIGKDSATKTLAKKKNYVFEGKKKGCKSTRVTASKSIDGNTFWGIFWDLGLISIFLIDGAGTGAVKKFDDESFDVTPDCDEGEV